MDLLSYAPPVEEEMRAVQLDTTHPDRVALDQLNKVEQFISHGVVAVGIVNGSNVAQDGIYVSPRVLESSGVGPEASNLSMTGFEMLPGFQLGAGDSHHSVLFGNVLIEMSGIKVLVDVALKSYDADSHKAEYEHEMLGRVAGKGFITFLPIGIARNGSDAYLMTQVMANMETLDNVDWTAKVDSAEYNNLVVRELAFIADYLASLHSEGVFHGDAQPKNIARNDVGEKIILDLEDAVISRDADEHIRHIMGGWDVSESKALNDLAHCWYVLTHPTSLEGNNILYAEESYETCMVEFESRFMGPYLESLQAKLAPEIRAQFDAQIFANELTKHVAART